MPTYSYVCKDCGHAFDVQQAFTDDALTACPECAGSLRKVFSAVGVVFKGSGFYRTDSRGSSTSSSSSAGTGKSETGATTGASSARTAPKDSAPAAASTSSTGSSPKSTGAG